MTLITSHTASPFSTVILRSLINWCMNLKIHLFHVWNIFRFKMTKEATICLLSFYLCYKTLPFQPIWAWSMWFIPCSRISAMMDMVSCVYNVFLTWNLKLTCSILKGNPQFLSSGSHNYSFFLTHVSLTFSSDAGCFQSPAPSFTPGLLCAVVYPKDTQLKEKERPIPFTFRCPGAELYPEINTTYYFAQMCIMD